MVYVLAGVLTGLLLLSYWQNKGDLTAPSFLFSLSFLFSCVWACIYAPKWELDMHTNTFYVIFGGVLEFIVVSQIIHVFSNIRRRKKDWIYKQILPIEIQKGKLIAFIALEILVILATAYYLLRSIGAANLANAIFLYRYGDISENIRMPGMLNILRTCVNASGYWFSYVLINNLIAKKKLDLYPLVIILLALVNTVVVGSRGNVLYVLISMIIIYYILFHRNSANTGKQLRFRSVLISVVVLIAVVLSYQSLGNLLGRNSTANSIDYLATYCGAEIKNLDMMLQRDIFGKSKIFGAQTFINMYRWMGARLGGIDVSEIKFALSFISINGYNLGNVYTIFYPMIYDFGYQGIFFLILLMACIAQWIDERVKRSSSNHELQIVLVVYAYMANAIIFSFFSNKFYEQIFSAVFIYSLIFWGLFQLFFIRIRFRIGKK
ncbi:MAG: oligosaccharide repeat unit polymerase [Clostridia bacterium]|nr:oligosaccharide repeat unit polymerase [Clostridia bacterium]